MQIIQEHLKKETYDRRLLIMLSNNTQILGPVFILWIGFLGRHKSMSACVKPLRIVGNQQAQPTCNTESGINLNLS